MGEVTAEHGEVHQADESTVRLVGISASLREVASGGALLHGVREVAPGDVVVELHQLDDIPRFDPDIERELGYPAQVRVLRESIAVADGVLLASPEYDPDGSGDLGNALAWASHGPDSPLREKVVGLLAPTSDVGLAARRHLEQLLAPNRVTIIDATDTTGAADAAAGRDARETLRGVVEAVRSHVVARRPPGD